MLSRCFPKKKSHFLSELTETIVKIRHVPITIYLPPLVARIQRGRPIPTFDLATFSAGATASSSTTTAPRHRGRFSCQFAARQTFFSPVRSFIPQLIATQIFSVFPWASHPGLTSVTVRTEPYWMVQVPKGVLLLIRWRAKVSGMLPNRAGLFWWRMKEG